MAADRRRPPFQCIALTLQGGGALGAYQAGVYQALAEADLHPDWVAGISIGSINAAIIAGNPPEARVEKLRGFWEQITATPELEIFEFWRSQSMPGELGRKFEDRVSAGTALMMGVPGFFRPRMPSFLDASGSPAATSFYNTNPLVATLKRFVDFERINSGLPRLSIGAVNVATGNFAYFDSTKQKIGPEHILASGALPPGFPAIAIDGAHYWDGGLVSNSPLQWVLQFGPRQDTIVFEVDLWSAQGRLPRDIMEVAMREKEIRYSSRTRENMDRFADTQRLRHAVARLIADLPKDVRERECAVALDTFADQKVYNIIHLIYRSKIYEGNSQDYEFSAPSMRDHWNAGHRDTVATLSKPEVLERPKNPDGIAIFDLAARVSS